MNEVSLKNGSKMNEKQYKFSANKLSQIERLKNWFLSCTIFKKFKFKLFIVCHTVKKVS